MASTKITFSKADVTPPVFVAGSFSDWQPIELDHEQADEGSGNYKYSKTLDISAGEHQYKFRLGEGDWWVTDESTPTAADKSGNLNNVLTVQSKANNESTLPNNTEARSEKKAPKDTKISNIEVSSTATDQYKHTNGNAAKGQLDGKQDLNDIASKARQTADRVPSGGKGLFGSTTVWAAVFVVLIAGYLKWK